jgi:hypothetical protein
MTEGRAIMFLTSDLSFAGLPLNTAPYCLILQDTIP